MTPERKFNAEPVGVRNRLSIDALGCNPKTKQAIVDMIENRPWGDIGRWKRELFSKLNVYVKYIEELLFVDHPELSRERPLIAFICTYPPPPVVAELLKEVEKTLNARGIAFSASLGSRCLEGGAMNFERQTGIAGARSGAVVDKNTTLWQRPGGEDLSAVRTGLQYPNFIDAVCVNSELKRVVLIMNERRNWSKIKIDTWRAELAAKSNAYLKYIEHSLFSAYPEAPRGAPIIELHCVGRPPSGAVESLRQVKSLMKPRGIDFIARDVATSTQIDV